MAKRNAVLQDTMQEKGNSVQIRTISEASMKKLQDIPTDIQGIAKITKVHPMLSEDSRRPLEDFQSFSKNSQRLPKMFEHYSKIPKISEDHSETTDNFRRSLVQINIKIQISFA